MTDGQSLARLPDFRRYWASRAVSMLGSCVTYVALPVLVYRMTGSPAWTAAMAAVDTLPFVLFGLLGGVLGDRLPRRRVMVAADVLAALAIGSIVLAHVLGRLTLGHLLLGAFVAATATTIFDGANWGALPLLVGRDRLPGANAAVQGVVAVFDAAGPALVGLALTVVAPGTLLLVDAASFAASALLIRGITATMSVPRASGTPAGLTWGGVLRDMREGMAYLWRHPLLRPMTFLTMCGSAGSAGLLAVLVAWAAQILRIGTDGWRFGALYAAWGSGALLAALALAPVLARVDAIALTRRLLPVVVLLAASLPFVSRVEAAIPLLLAYSAAHTLQFTAVLTWRQQVIPDALLSRVASAARLLGWGAAATLGALVTGPVAQGFGVRAGLAVVAACHALALVLSRRRALGPGAGRA